jgi:membrane dipeptidase
VSVDDARRILHSHPVIDGHNDLPWAMRELNGYDIDGYRLDERQSKTHTDLVRAREGGLGGQFWSVFVPATLSGESAVTATLEQVDFVLHMIASFPDRLALALSAGDVASAIERGRIASLMGAEGGHSIASSLAVLRVLHSLGVRYLTLTHNANVPWADSATDAEVHGGLTAFGRDVVREMNALGMLVDLSHVSVPTMHDALETTRVPVMFSHSSARAVTDHVRNVPDDVLAALATNGGICMVTFVPSFVSTACFEWDLGVIAEMESRGEDRRDWQAHVAAAARYAKRRPAPTATVADVADHVEHVRAVAGVEHVGIGGDFDGTTSLPDGLRDVAGYPALIDELAGRGWSEPDLAALTCENILRVLRESDVGTRSR